MSSTEDQDGPIDSRRAWLEAWIEVRRREPPRADTKASLLLVVPSVGLALGAGHLGGLSAPAAVAGWAAVAAAVLAVGLLGAVVWPQLKGLPSLDEAALLAASEVASDNPEVALKELVAQAAWWGRITTRKYRLLRAAIGCLGTALVLALVSTALA